MLPCYGVLGKRVGAWQSHRAQRTDWYNKEQANEVEFDWEFVRCGYDRQPRRAEIVRRFALFGE